MSNQFYPLKIKDIIKTTEDCSVLVFDINDTLKPIFSYKQGQHLTLKVDLSGEELRRSYSLCSSPLEGEWKVAVKKIDGGKFSTYANDELKVGDTLEVMPPHGSFYVDSVATQAKNYAAFAAGSGITPIISIIKTHLHQEPNCTFKLFYTNQYASSIILKEEIEGLKNLFIERLEVFYFLTQEERDIALLNGRMDQEKLDILSKYVIDLENIDDYFLCGPEEMIFLVKNYLEAHNVNAKKIHFELFNTSAGQKKAKSTTQQLSGKNCEVTIIEGGKSMKFNMPQGGDNILDVALGKSANLPFACKGGVCCTCKAKLVEGQVQMDVNYALEQEQLDAGYILTCQATPISEHIVVNFDL